jgi:pyroglutamyl-peptidase
LTIVFTGFGPFLDVEYNPSWDAAQAAAEVSGSSAHLLPVTLQSARSIGGHAENAAMLVHFGVAKGRDEVCLERYAHNWWGDRGAVPTRLEDKGPAARECVLPLDAWAKELGCRVSHDAGIYVCNATLYYALAATPEAMFVHIPAVEPKRARDIGRSIAELLLAVSI